MVFHHMRRAAMASVAHGRTMATDLPKVTGAITGGGRGPVASFFLGEEGRKMPTMMEPLEGCSVVHELPVEAPTTVQTTLSNGAVVASENSPGATVALGVYVASGSVNETRANAGASHFLERLAFKTTAHRTHFRLTREAEAIGANMLATASREQMAYTVDTLKTFIPEAVEVLLDSVLNPNIQAWELNEVAKTLSQELVELKNNPQALLMEALHETAYSNGLGRPLMCPEYNLKGITPERLMEFVEENYTAPRICLAAAGCSQDELLFYAAPLLEARLSAQEKQPEPKSVYVGGDFRQASDSEQTNTVLCFESKGGWRDTKTATAMTVLQVLMGGGGSFSSGGPGKGMYSRLYTNVLNKKSYAHNCTAFHSVFNDTGIVGIHSTSDAAHAGDMVDVMCEELMSVANAANISSVELERAKKLTISSVLMNLESRAVVCEDIGRQVLTYGSRKSPAEFCNDVRNLTAADVASVAANLLKTPLTMASMGSLEHLPRYDVVAKRF